MLPTSILCNNSEGKFEDQAARDVNQSILINEKGDYPTDAGFLYWLDVFGNRSTMSAITGCYSFPSIKGENPKLKHQKSRNVTIKGSREYSEGSKTLFYPNLDIGLGSLGFSGHPSTKGDMLFFINLALHCISLRSAWLTLVG
ncbi:hypothetical protein ACH5RR_009781 [Cinchona calisaya]|uniref:Uncharacterized protein n=1 Tax=Cinchona calisaya TaxID=153742 RepID=A0ABD3AFC6_9GENT